MSKDGRINTDVLKEFFDKVKSIGVIQRIFFWRRFLDSYVFDAYSEFGKMESFLSDAEKGTEKIIEEKRELEKQNENLKGKTEEMDKRINNIEKDNQTLSDKKTELEKELGKFRNNEEKNKEEFVKNMSRMDELKKHLEEQIKRHNEERETEIRTGQERRERIWKDHESKVEETIKTICSRNTIDYIPKEKFPHTGAPDNCVLIADQYIVFDAKAPKSEDPKQFKSYIKEQAERLVKYAKNDDVKNDMFLVVPVNMIEEFSEKFIRLGDYRVYIVSIDSLEPILLSLKAIENYEEFVELSPEDRENISKVIGRLANTAKRRIQIDQFFAEQSISDLKECNKLPEEIKKNAVEVEKSSKLNPPQQRRAKELTITNLTRFATDMKKEASHININTDIDPKKIEEIPLNKKK